MATSPTVRDSAASIGKADASGRPRRVIVFVALVTVLLVATGAALDYRSFDRTRGGYEPPYEGWTGTPIDWGTTERTEHGFRQRGYVVSAHLDCTSGMLTFEVGPFSIDFRTVSARAIAVHQPQAACEAEGFAPRF
jgi:hypothetical protein